MSGSKAQIFIKATGKRFCKKRDEGVCSKHAAGKEKANKQQVQQILTYRYIFRLTYIEDISVPGISNINAAPRIHFSKKFYNRYRDIFIKNVKEKAYDSANRKRRK